MNFPDLQKFRLWFRFDSDILVDWDWSFRWQYSRSKMFSPRPDHLLKTINISICKCVVLNLVATFFQLFGISLQHFSPVIALQHISLLIHTCIWLQHPMCHMLDCMGVALIYVSLLKSVALLSVVKNDAVLFWTLEKMLHSFIKTPL